MLEELGHSVTEAATGAEAIAALKKSASDCDLLISDYAMPGGTGTWMLNEAERRGLLEHTVALIVTAHPDLDVERIVRESALVVDFRGATRGIEAPNLVRL